MRQVKRDTVAHDDARGKYQAMLADLYPGEAIEAPAAIDIGGEAPDELTVDFGIVKGADGWHIPEQFRDMAGPVLLREAYRAGLPGKTANAPAMVHTCNWFAWKSIGDKAVQKRFYDVWLAAARVEKPGAAVYSLPPAWIREIDKALDIDPRELHGLLVRYSAENERLLGKQLRYDAAVQWAAQTAIELAPVPSPPVFDLLYAFTANNLETKDVPARQWLIDRVVAAPRFAPSYAAKRVAAAFPAFADFCFVAWQVDQSLAGKRFAYLFFTPSQRSLDIDWDALLHVPGMFLGTWKAQGALMEGGEAGVSYIARYCIPSTSLDAWLGYLSALADNGFFTSHHAYVSDESWFAENFNCYVPHPSAPSYVVGPVRDEPDLLQRSVVRYASTPAQSARFLARVAGEGFKEMGAFIDKATSPFSLNSARYDSWFSAMAGEARVSPDVAKRWLHVIVDECGYLTPEPRNTYYFNPHTSPLTRINIITRGNITAADRMRMVAPFPASFVATCRGLRAPDMTLWNAYIPRGQLERAMRIVYDLAPEARPAVIIDTPVVRPGFKNLGWFDGEGYARATDALARYASAVPRVAKGEWTLSRFQREVTQPAEAAFDAT